MKSTPNARKRNRQRKLPTQRLLSTSTSYLRLLKSERRSTSDELSVKFRKNAKLKAKNLKTRKLS